MTRQHALQRLQHGDFLSVHTPDPPAESFYFLAPDFATVTLPLGRKLRALPGMTMLLRTVPGHPGVLYFYWKLAPHVTPEEARSNATLFCHNDRFDDAPALKSQFPHHFTVPLPTS